MRPHRNTIHSGSVLFSSLATLVCPLAFVAAASSEPAPGAAAPWISPRLLAASRDPAEASAIERRPTGASPFVALFVRGPFDRAEARARGVAIGARAGDWTTARIPLERLESLASLPGVDAIVLAHRCPLALDSAVADSRVASIRVPGPDGFLGPTGAGVLIGVVDTGIDLGHPDFRRPDGTTRLVSLWDQASAAGSPPAGYAYGSEWDASAIDGGIVASADDWGHGTHVAGIAAGNGRGGTAGLDQNRYAGIAPDASLCVVKADFSSGGAGATDVVDGVAYIFEKAAALGVPTVVNLSLGGHQGPHDGTDPFDRMFSALTGPGRIVVAAAGNEGQSAIHAVGVLPPGGATVLKFAVPSYAPNEGAANDRLLLSAWLDPLDAATVTVTTPSGFVVGPVGAGASATSSTSDGAITLCAGACAIPAGALTEIELSIEDAEAAAPPRTGTWTMTIARGATGGSGVVDAYTAEQTLGTHAPWVVWTQGGVTYGTLRSPATGDSIVAIGAHVTKACWTGEDGLVHCGAPEANIGKRAAYSSRGPRRDGVLRPDLTAPGSVVVSTRSAAAAFAATDVVEGGGHAALQGTSMAAPHVAGIVALLLSQEGWHDAHPSRVRAALRSTARADGFTGAIPTNEWGYGKADVTELLDLTPTGAEVSSPAGALPSLSLARAVPNPFHPRTALRLDVRRAGRVVVRVHAPTGRLVRTLFDGIVPVGARRIDWDGRDEAGRAAASGVYHFVASSEDGRVVRKATLLR
ncbi:MAG TPA: S8 family serine peptidase [Acidobacteriota bacterium]|nr:S8 family serine peptidase [Acidobacteriota bacterium]